MTQIQAAKKALINLPKCVEQSDGFTTREYALEEGISQNRATALIRRLFDAGVIEGTKRKLVKDMSGRLQTVPAYRLVKGRK